MNYELAKRLKDAGFPQAADDEGTLHKGQYLFPDHFSLSSSRKTFNVAVAYAPTLSELIEACGDQLTTLGKVGGLWCAYSEPALAWSGQTAKEAVANLWLALNEK